MTRPRWPANRYLTPAMERVLRRMRDEDLELDHVAGESFWYLDTTRVHPATARHLLEYVLISGQFAKERGDIGHFTINEDGRGCLDDPAYVPRMVRVVRQERNKGLEMQAAWAWAKAASGAPPWM